jgi:hypothetical protein
VAVDAGDRETSNTEPRLNVGTSPSRMPSTRSLLATALAAATLVAVPMPAQAADVEYVDRSTYDSTPVVTTSTIHIDGATAGPLGGFLDLTVSAEDGTLPTTRGACDPVDVDAVLTVSPGEQLVVHTTAEVWMHQFSETLIMQAYSTRRTSATPAPSTARPRSSATAASRRRTPSSSDSPRRSRRPSAGDPPGRRAVQTWQAGHQ